MAFRDQLVDELGVNLVGSVQASIDEGAVQEETGMNASRNLADHHTHTIEGTILTRAWAGSARESSRQSGFSHQDDFGQWDPRTNVLSCGTCSTAKSGWVRTSGVPHLQLDRNGRLAVHLEEDIAIPELYFAKERNDLYNGSGFLSANSSF